MQATFARFPQLLSFVAAAPSADASAHFRALADKLGAHISHVPPPLPTSALDTPVRRGVGAQVLVGAWWLHLRPAAPCARLTRLCRHQSIAAQVGGWRWTSTAEALRILGELSTARVGLLGFWGRGWEESNGAAGEAAPARHSVAPQRRPPTLHPFALPPAQMSLALLESTGIAGAVAQLRNHRDPAVSTAAEHVTAMCAACLGRQCQPLPVTRAAHCRWR